MRCIIIPHHSLHSEEIIGRRVLRAALILVIGEFIIGE
jgi:hypothetical protein